MTSSKNKKYPFQPVYKFNGCLQPRFVHLNVLPSRWCTPESLTSSDRTSSVIRSLFGDWSLFKTVLEFMCFLRMREWLRLVTFWNICGVFVRPCAERLRPNRSVLCTVGRATNKSEQLQAALSVSSARLELAYLFWASCSFFCVRWCCLVHFF